MRYERILANYYGIKEPVIRDLLKEGLLDNGLAATVEAAYEYEEVPRGKRELYAKKVGISRLHLQRTARRFRKYFVKLRGGGRDMKIAVNGFCVSSTKLWYGEAIETKTGNVVASAEFKKSRLALRLELTQKLHQEFPAAEITWNV